VEVKVGDYLLEVNGADVRPPNDVYSYLENTAGKQIHIKVGPNPDGKDAHEVTVLPVADEAPLRTRAWEEDNRRKVNDIERGKIAYVHVPDTANGGFLNFNRFYFAQTDKQAAVIDDATTTAEPLPTTLSICWNGRCETALLHVEGEKWCSPLAQFTDQKR